MYTLVAGEFRQIILNTIVSPGAGRSVDLFKQFGRHFAGLIAGVRRARIDIGPSDPGAAIL
jgi:hypothetical protein